MTNIRQTALLRHPAGLAPEVSCAGTSDVTRRRFFTAPWPCQPAPGVPQGSAPQRIVLAAEHASPGQPVKDLRVRALAHASSRSAGPGGF